MSTPSNSPTPDGYTPLATQVAELRLRIEELRQMLAPIMAYIRVNDSDTLARLSPDSKVVACATGSWSRPSPITLGDLRAIYRAVQELDSIQAL